jgi:hypothetical protein
MLDPFDDATLRFCASLPEVLRGKVYESSRTVEQLSAMTLERYVPGGGATPLYVPDEAYDEAAMTEAEAIYLRSLRAALDARGLQPLGASR